MGSARYYSEKKIQFKLSFQIPKCPDLTNQKPRLTKRSHKDLPPVMEDSGLAEVDVRAQQLNVLDPQIGEQIGQPQRFVHAGGQSFHCIPVGLFSILKY